MLSETKTVSGDTQRKLNFLKQKSQAFFAWLYSKASLRDKIFKYVHYSKKIYITCTSLGPYKLQLHFLIKYEESVISQLNTGILTETL